MEKQTVEAHLSIQKGRPVVTVKGREGQTDLETLIAYLKNGVSSGEMKACTPKSEKGYTTFKFKVYDELKNLNNYFVIKVKNNERYLHKETIEQIKEITGVSNLITKVNVNRLVAGVAVSALILTLSTPLIAKGLHFILKKDYQYDQYRYNRFDYYSSAPLEDWQREQMEQDYYQDLEKRASEGDKQAQDEFEIYIEQQRLREQAEQEAKSRGGK